MFINEPFYHSVSSTEVTQKTSVQITKADNGLHFSFVCSDNPFTKYNKFKENNQPLWQQEVLEIFISHGEEIKSDYIEFQINPNSAIFLAKVTNHCLTGKNNTLNFLDPSLFNINASIDIDYNNNEWKGQFTLPFELIGGAPFIYRLNIFRIIATTKPQSLDWRGTPETCVYSCWKPTSELTKPSFHQPQSFALVKF